jgi:tRNA threonylcarbamoyladenosine biosynthesis protein TsaB
MAAPGEPRLLILETSSRIGQVALAVGETLRAVRRLDEARRHARDLAPALAEMLRGQGWRARDLNAVVVSRGPGSYTGLRVGIMSAKALAYATGCALIGIDTFAAVALQAPPQVGQLDVLADAQQAKVYVQRFARIGSGDAWQPLTPLVIEPLTDWLARRASGLNPEEPAWVSGPGLYVYGGQLPEAVPMVDAGRWDPQPDSLLHLGLARFKAGEHDDPWALEPHYLRPSAAEEQWRRGPASRSHAPRGNALP